MQITTKHQQLQPIQPILQLVKQVVSTNASQGLVFTTNLAYFFGQIQKRAKKLVIQVVCTNAPLGLVFTTNLTYFLAKSKKRQIIELQDRIKLLLSQVICKKKIILQFQFTYNQIISRSNVFHIIISQPAHQTISPKKQGR